MTNMRLIAVCCGIVTLGAVVAGIITVTKREPPHQSTVVLDSPIGPITISGLPKGMTVSMPRERVVIPGNLRAYHLHRGDGVTGVKLTRQFTDGTWEQLEDVPWEPEEGLKERLGYTVTVSESYEEHADGTASGSWDGYWEDGMLGLGEIHRRPRQKTGQTGRWQRMPKSGGPPSRSRYTGVWELEQPDGTWKETYGLQATPGCWPEDD